MRLLGAVLVLFATTIAGFVIARSFIFRVRLLTELESALQTLETEINYGLSSLPQAFDRVASDFKAPVADLFSQANEGLKRGQTAKLSWLEAVNNLETESSLLSSDLRILEKLAHNFGVTDRKEQLKHLKLAQQKLATAIKEASQLRDRNVKLWRYLGFLLGALIIILIF